MECKTEGDFVARIIDASVIYNHYDQNSDTMEVKLEFQAADAEQSRGFAYLDLSDNYGIGNNSNKTQAEISEAKLMYFGVDIRPGGEGKAAVKKMIGKEVSLFGKVKGNYHNFYLNTRSPDREVSDADYATKYKGGTQNAAPSPSPAPALGVQAPNPFAK